MKEFPIFSFNNWDILNPSRKFIVVEWMRWMQIGHVGPEHNGYLVLEDVPLYPNYAGLLCLGRAPGVKCPWMIFLIGGALVRRVKWGRGRFFILSWIFFLGWIKVYKKPSHSQTWSSSVVKTTATRITYIHTFF